MKAFYENYFRPQNVTPDSMLFSPEHIILSSLGVLFIVYLFRAQLQRCDINYSKKILKRSAVIMLSLEIFRIVWSTFYYGFSLKNIRFDWCNQISMALPFVVLSGKEKLYPYIDILSFMGGAGVLLCGNTHYVCSKHDFPYTHDNYTNFNLICIWTLGEEKKHTKTSCRICIHGYGSICHVESTERELFDYAQC